MPTPTGGGTYSDVPFTGTKYIDALVGGTKWGGPAGSPVSLAYSFPGDPGTWSTDSATGYGPVSGEGEPWQFDYAPLTGVQQAAFEAALATWAEVANIAFTEVADTAGNVGDIRVAASGILEPYGASAWAYFPWSGPAAGDVWINPYDPSYDDLPVGGFGFSVLVHEIGHALGLGHSFDGAVKLAGKEDSLKYTVMSYTDHPYASLYASQPMLYDIAAIQYLYGANMTTRAGDTLYAFSATTEELMAIWDAGGVDTFDLSNQTLGATVNLAAGTFSSIGVLDTGGKARDNVAVAYNVTIENAKGGSGADKITGNAVANDIDGNGGNDTLAGGGGDDTLDGGAGTDKLDGGAGNDTFIVDALDTVTDSSGFDTIETATSYSIGKGKGVESVQLTGAAAANLTGGKAGDLLIGNGANNLLSGAKGNDTLRGGGGDDTLTGGGKGRDVFDYDALTDRGSGAERIADFAKGAAGDALDFADLLDGLAGYNGSNAFTGGYLRFQASGADTLVQVDADGGGNGYVTLVTLTGAVLTEADTGNFLL